MYARSISDYSRLRKLGHCGRRIRGLGTMVSCFRHPDPREDLESRSPNLGPYSTKNTLWEPPLRDLLFGSSRGSGQVTHSSVNPPSGPLNGRTVTACSTSFHPKARTLNPQLSLSHPSTLNAVSRGTWGSHRNSRRPASVQGQTGSCQIRIKPCAAFSAWGSCFRVEGLGFGFRVYIRGLQFRVKGSGSGH